MADNDDFREWASGQHLSEGTVSVLFDNGIDSREALLCLRTEDLPQLGLNLGQFAIMRNLIHVNPPPQLSTGRAGQNASAIARSLQIPPQGVRSVLAELFHQSGQQHGASSSSTAGPSQGRFAGFESFRTVQASRRRPHPHSSFQGPTPKKPSHDPAPERGRTLTVVLVNHGTVSIPRGQKRQQLVLEGKVRDICVKRSWTETRCRDAIAELFPTQLTGDDPGNSLLYLSTSTGLRLIEAQNLTSLTWNGERLINLANRGNLYVTVRPQVPPPPLPPQSPLPSHQQQGSEIQQEDYEVIDSEPASMNSSPDSESDEASSPSMRPANALIASHRRRVIKKGTQRIDVTRDHTLLEQVFNLYSSPSFDTKKMPAICYEGEAGCDAGGLKRDFYTAVLRAIVDPSKGLFEGSGELQLPARNSQALLEGKYHFVGKFLASSLVHGGATQCLSFPVVSFLAGVPVCDISVGEEFVSSSTVKKAIAELKCVGKPDSTGPGETDLILDVMQSSGVSLPITPSNVQRIIRNLVLHDTILSRSAQLQAMKAGMNELQVGELLEQHPHELSSCFTFETSDLTPQVFYSLIRLPSSPSSSEKQTIDYLTQYIHTSSIDDRSKLLTFITGSHVIPPLGFPKLIDLVFTAEPKLPSASTCLLLFKLSTAKEDFTSFARDMDTALTESSFQLI